ncbi:MAG TPA: secondary thiamine-phosphate synthase enzyme YjbQ [Candidatus Omnitrophota bacterium]|nr:secondary thiamine-phosphate synthase enzyme YjbQ [Candidatus Omnitrophota bacterium]
MYNKDMHKIKISTSCREEIIDITLLINNYLKKEKLISGVLLIYSPHTTAGISVNENADPDVKRDINYFLKKTVPQNFGFAHNENNADAHIKGALVGFSQNFIVEDNTLQLGTWQGIFFMEFDGPRNREVWLKFTPHAH